MIDIYKSIVHYVLTTDLDRLNDIDNFWSVTKSKR